MSNQVDFDEDDFPENDDELIELYFEELADKFTVEENETGINMGDGYVIEEFEVDRARETVAARAPAQQSVIGIKPVHVGGA